MVGESFVEMCGPQERLSPGRLTSPQRQSFAEQLSRGELGKIAIRFLSGDAGCQNFALEISAVCQSCGWTVVQMGSVSSISGIWSVGLRVIAQDPQKPQTLALLAAFERIGIVVPVTIISNAHHQSILWWAVNPE